MKNLYKALAAFQQECPVILKDTSGFGYKYADLPAILEVINPLLKKHGLGFYQAVIIDELRTVVFHAESGEHIEAQASIPQNVQLKGMNEFQVLGSAITYLRRYQLSSMLGIVTDKDTDASGEQVKPKLQGESLAKAKKYLSEGGNLDTIKKKYYIEDKTLKELENV